MAGLLMVTSLAASAAEPVYSCEGVWGDPATFESDWTNTQRVLGIKSGDTMVSRTKVGELLRGYAKTHCAAPFARLSEAKQQPYGFVHHVMSESNMSLKGEVTPDMPVGHLKDMVEYGVYLGLVPKTELTTQMETRRQAALAAGKLQTVRQFITVMGANSKNNRVSDADKAEFLRQINEIKGLQAADVELDARLAKAEKMVAAGVVAPKMLDDAVAALEGQIGKLRDTVRLHGLEIGGLKERTAKLEASYQVMAEQIGVANGAIAENAGNISNLGETVKKMGATVSTFDGRIKKLEKPFLHDLVLAWGGEDLAKSYTFNPEKYQVWTAAVVAAVLVLLAVLISWLLGRKTRKDVGNLAKQVARHRVYLFGDKRSNDPALRTSLRMRQSAVERQASEAVHMAEDALDVAAHNPADEMPKWNSSNLTIDMLANLTEGKEYAVEWKGTYKKRPFVIKIWREQHTPKGQVQTDVVRNEVSGQETGEAFALKRLKLRLENAVMNGRVPLGDPVAQAV